jgi:hypothetical protein
MTLVLEAHYVDPVVYFNVKFQRKFDSAMLRVLLIECNGDGIENGNRTEFCDVTRVVFWPRKSKRGVLIEPYVMGLVRFDADTSREEEIIDKKIKALRFRRDQLDYTLVKEARAYNDPAYKWFSELGWKYQQHEYDQEYPGRTEYRLVIKNPNWICPPPTKSDVDIIRGRHNDDKKELKAWRCAICFLGLPKDGIEEEGIKEDDIEEDDIEEDCELVSAHEAKIIDDEKHVIHVFHKKCLDKWMIANSTCPICRTVLNCKPLLDRWKLGNTTLSARMGGNPFIVACTRAHRL